jgi:phage FluMu protein Com
MPIRFRCAYCNQLMGIARRKAGTVVRCPTCSGQVVVPAAETSTAQAGTSSPDKPALFEHQDFDQIFAPTTNQPRPENGPTAASKAQAPDLSLDVDLLTAPSIAPGSKTGVVLSPMLLIFFGVFVLILLALAFIAGYFVGAAS